LYPSKKEAEQLAAKNAYDALRGINVYSLSSMSTAVSTLDEPPSYSEVVNMDSSYRLPNEYADIEQFIEAKVGVTGGRIRKISPPDSRGQYKFQITGTYRYCEKIGRHHTKNQIYFIVDPVNRTYVQKCYDSDCHGFQSAVKYIDNEQTTHSDSSEEDSTSKCSRCQKILRHGTACERCGQNFCSRCLYECELCHDALHCSSCIDSCFDCHDS
jgi:hypothetical protein